MEPLTDSNTFPLSIAHMEATVYAEPPLASALLEEVPTDSALRGQLLTAVIARAGDVEAAEWALDQAKSACGVQMAAALALGVPAERVAAAAGVYVSALPQFMPGPTRTGQDRVPSPSPAGSVLRRCFLLEVPATGERPQGPAAPAGRSMMRTELKADVSVDGRSPAF